MLESVDDVIEALGGTSAVASMVGKKSPAISNWRARGRIPSDWWSVIVASDEAKAAGVTTDVLARLAAREPAEART